MYLEQHELRECNCRLNDSVCNPKQKWNHGDCWCEYIEKDDCIACKDNYMLNSSKCDCECNKAYKIDEYLNIKNCSCEKRLYGK